MAKAFRVEQEISGAQGVRSNTRPTGNISLGTFNLGSLRGVTDALSNLTEDKDEKALGRDIAKIRFKMGNNPNSAQRAINIELARTQLTKKYGARLQSLINQGLAGIPKATNRLDVENRQLISTTGLGQRTVTPLDPDGDKQAALKITGRTVNTILAKLQATLPRFSAAADVIFKGMFITNEKQGITKDPSFLIGVAGRATLSISSLEKGAELLASLDQLPQMKGLSESAALKAQVMQDSLSNFVAFMTFFGSGYIGNKLANFKANGILPAQMGSLVGTYLDEYSVALQKHGRELGIDGSQLIKIVTGIQELRGQYEKLFTLYSSRNNDAIKIQEERVRLALSLCQRAEIFRAERGAIDQTDASITQ